MLSIIVATAENNAIGFENKLLWHISDDLKFFKATTMGHPVIMGRRTFESIGRLLPGRKNIIVTRGGASFPEGAVCVTDIQKLIRDVHDSPLEFFVMGGASIYKETFPFADKLYITKIFATPAKADVFFPAISLDKWTVSSESQRFKDEENNLDFQFIVYERKRQL